MAKRGQGMNYRTYRVWRVLLDKPNEWIDVMSIAKLVNMTSRQVSSVVGMMGSPHVMKERDEDDKKLYVIVKGTDDEIFKLKNYVVSGYFGLSVDEIECVHGSLSPIGWMSVADIADDTGIERIGVSRILSILPDVVTKSTGSVTMYRLKECV